MIQRLVPGDFAPRVFDRRTEHRLGDAFLMCRITPGETPLHAGMAMIGLAVLVRSHPDDLVALKLRFESAADTAIGAGREDRTLWNTTLNYGFFHQCRRGTCLDAGAAGDTFGIEKVLIHSCGNM